MDRIAGQFLTLTALGAGVVIAGCAKKDVAPTTDSATAVSSTAQTITSPDGYTRTGPPVKRIDDSGRKIFVQVEKGPDAYVVDYKHHPTGEMRVGRFSNIGDGNGHRLGRESIYKFDGLPGARYSLVILPEGDPQHHNQTKWELREEMANGSAGDDAVLTGYLELCEPYHDPNQSAAVGFKHCPGPNPPAVKKSSMVNLELLPRLFSRLLNGTQGDSAGDKRDPSDTDPAWVSCSDGCCSLSGATRKGQQ